MRTYIWRAILAALVLALLVPTAAEAQKKKKKKKSTDTTAQKTVSVEVLPLFDRGAYSAVVDAVDMAAGPEVLVSPDAVFVAGMSQEAMRRLGQGKQGIRRTRQARQQRPLALPGRIRGGVGRRESRSSVERRGTWRRASQR